MFMFLIGLMFRPTALLFVVVMVVASILNRARMTTCSEDDNMTTYVRMITTYVRMITTYVRMMTN
jgi:uncharacterized membrane protein YphA (DoxX/SURF4 family)